MLSIGEFGIWTLLLVHGYARDGHSKATGIVPAQLIPAALLTPLAGALADRGRPARTLCAVYALQAAAIGAMAATLAFSGPGAVVFVLAALAALGLDLTPPAQAALAHAPWGRRASSAPPTCSPFGAILRRHSPDLRSPASPSPSGASARRWSSWRSPTRSGPPWSSDSASARCPIRAQRTTDHSAACVPPSPPPQPALLVSNGFSHVLVGALDVISVVLLVRLLHSAAQPPAT